MTDIGATPSQAGGAGGEIPGGFDPPGARPRDAAAAAATEAPDGGNFALPSFNRAIGKGAAGGPIELLKDVDLNVKIELGRTRMLIEDVLKLAEGSVVELDKLAGDPVDVFVNEQLVARGEVLVLNDNFCVRINEIVSALEEE
jgi:flagellar motor switch protein FliN/FliY